MRSMMRADWGLVIAALGLSIIGTVLIWSATHHQAGSALAVRQIIAIVIGVGLALALIRLDMRWLRVAAPWVYVAGVAGLVAVLTPLGQTVNGSRSWIFLPGGFSLQPAELAKLALLIGLAMVLSHGTGHGTGSGRDPGRGPGARRVIGAWALAAVPVLLILAQPDLGSALVFGAMAIGVVAVSGAAVSWTVAAIGATAAGVIAAIRIPLLEPYQVDRLVAFRDPTLDPDGIGYQSAQAAAAIRAGGWDGAGLAAGERTQSGAIPFQHTDFVFSVAAEELGFWGSTGLILLLAFVVLRALWIALRTDDSFVRLVAVGVACWFAFQTFQNIGMNLGLMPITGLPLPFVSYGGTSMVACWVAIGLLLSSQSSRTSEPAVAR